MLIDVLHSRSRRHFRGPASMRNPLHLLLYWTERMSQRRALSDLDRHLLGDIGLTPADALHEANKPFWRS